MRKLFTKATPIIPLNGATLGKEELKIAMKTLKNKALWQDWEALDHYEKAFASFNKCSNAFSFTSGRMALSACLEALELQAGDKVIVPAFTCVVVANAFYYKDIEVIFADIELDTFGLDAQKVKEKIIQNNGIKAILIQHSFGLVTRDYQVLLDVAQKHGLFIIEDCTHALGANYKGVPIGNLGHLAFFSTENSKNFSTFNGGMATTNSKEFAQNLKEIQDKLPFPSPQRTSTLLHNLVLRYYKKERYRQPWKYRLYSRKYRKQKIESTTKLEVRGQKPSYYEERFSPALANIGINQLKRLESINYQRRKGALIWDTWAIEHGFQPPKIANNSVPVYLRYPILVSPEMKRDLKWAKKLSVEIGLWFKSNLHPKPISLSEFRAAELAVKQCINFPTLLE